MASKFAGLDMRDKFEKWLTGGNAKKYSPEVILSRLDKISEYAVHMKITTGSLWEYANYNAFMTVFYKLISVKLHHMTDLNAHREFIVSGQLYLRFLKEIRRERERKVKAVIEKNGAESAIVLKSSLRKAIEPEAVIAWLVKQPNANGKLYLKSVVKQYMYSLSIAPLKLDLPMVPNCRNVFTCHSVEEFSDLWKAFKNAPNYKQVNISTSGMFSAGLGCLLRYLQHQSNNDPIGVKNDESIKSKAACPPGSEHVTPASSAHCVEFMRRELCAQTRPLTCTINGQAVVPSKQNWSQLLVAITERFIEEGNHNLATLDRKPMYGTQMFFLPTKADNGSCSLLSNGKWIFTSYNAQNVVTIIKNLCQHCGVDFNDVVITYEPINDAPLRSTQSNSHPAYVEPAASPKFALDPAVVEQLRDVLSAHFANGFRLNSPIELVRFRGFAAEDLGDAIRLSDEDLVRCISACGMVFNGKVFAVSECTKERIKELVEEYFTDGAQVIFFSEFYAKSENWLFGASVVSEDMLIDILRRLFPKLSFTQTYFGYTDASVFAALESEILRVWGDDVLLTYEQLAERLKYIPIGRIMYALGQNANFIWSSVKSFSHSSRIDISDEERETIREIAVRECNARGYASITDLPFGEIKKRNYELSVTAIHNAVFRICLSDKFDKRGKIVTRKGDTLDALAIVKEYCQTIEKCSLDDLLNYEKELTGEVHRWIPMEAGNTILVRIDKETYIADKYVHFDIEAVDAAIELYMEGDYLPLKSFTTFGTFPDCGQTWNMFLLESYCRRFSMKFRFDASSLNSRNAGAIIRKCCGLIYTEILTDAIANADVPLTDSTVGRFLLDAGYIGRTRSNFNDIIDRAKAIRERGD